MLTKKKLYFCFTFFWLMSSCSTKKPADLIITAAAVYTADKVFTKAESFAVTDGKIVATSGIQFLERPPIYENIDGIEAHIMNVYTLPEHRGEGIATALLNNIITQARDKKAGRILLHAIGKDQSIYEKLGFKSTQNEMELVLS